MRLEDWLHRALFVLAELASKAEGAQRGLMEVAPCLLLLEIKKDATRLVKLHMNRIECFFNVS